MWQTTLFGILLKLQKLYSVTQGFHFVLSGVYFIIIVGINMIWVYFHFCCCFWRYIFSHLSRNISPQVVFCLIFRKCCSPSYDIFSNFVTAAAFFMFLLHVVNNLFFLFQRYNTDWKIKIRDTVNKYHSPVLPISVSISPSILNSILKVQESVFRVFVCPCVSHTLGSLTVDGIPRRSRGLG